MMNDIIEKIDQRIKEIEAKLETISDKWVYIEKIYDSFPLSETKMDESDFFVAYVGSKNNKIDFEYLKQFASENRAFLEESEEGVLEALVEYFKDFFDQYDSMDDITDDDIKESRKFNKQFREYYNCSIKEVVELFKKQENTEIYDALLIIDKIYTIKNIHEDLEDEEFDEENFEEMKKSLGATHPEFNDMTFEEAKQLFDRMMKKHKLHKGGKNRKREINKKLDEIKKDIGLPNYKDEIIIAINEEKRRIKNKNSYLRNEIEKYKSVKKSLIRDQKSKQITSIGYIADRISDEDLLKEILIEIYNHNIPEQLKMEDEYKKLSSDHKNQLKIVFDKYGINCDVDTIDSSMEEADLEYELDSLKKIGFKDNDLIISIINVTSKDIVEKVVGMINEGYITTEFIKENANIFNRNSNESAYPIVIKNIKAFKDRDLNPQILCDDCKVLLTSNDRFIKNLDILEDYNLLKYLRDSTSYDFIKCDDLNQRIDFILELGFEDFLKENLSILEYNRNDYKKVLAMRKIGEEPDKIGKLLYMLADDLIKIEEVDNYLYNYNDFIEEDTTEFDLSDLSSFDKSSRLLNFEGILISKNKVYSQAKNNKVRFCDIVRNSILSKDEYESIKNSILGSKRI